MNREKKSLSLVISFHNRPSSSFSPRTSQSRLRSFRVVICVICFLREECVTEGG